MKILMSNDDGFLAPGLNILAKTLGEIAEVTVVAPDRNRSGASNSLTLTNPLRIMKTELGFISVNGTPTDCVHLAVTGFLKEMPDMVVSGINEGSNLSDDVLYNSNVFITPGGIFGSAGEKYVRVSLCATGEKIDEAIKKIASLRSQ